MRVILLQDVAKIGRRFEVTTVPDGYAMNKLVPKKMAIPATPENLKRVQSQKAKSAGEQVAASEQLGAAAAALAETGLKMEVPANEGGGLFQAIKPAEIVEAIKAQTSHVVPESYVVISDQIKHTGEFTIQLVYGDERHSCALEVVAA